MKLEERTFGTPCILTNNNFTRASRYFVHFLAIVAALRHETFSCQSPVYGVGEHNRKILAFIFLNLDYDR